MDNIYWVPKDGAVFVACPPAIGLLFRDYIVYYLFNLVFLCGGPRAWTGTIRVLGFWWKGFWEILKFQRFSLRNLVKLFFYDNPTSYFKNLNGTYCNNFRVLRFKIFTSDAVFYPLKISWNWLYFVLTPLSTFPSSQADSIAFHFSSTQWKMPNQLKQFAVSKVLAIKVDHSTHTSPI